MTPSLKTECISNQPNLPPQNKNPLPVQRRWGGVFQVVPTTLSGTRCLPMVPSLVGEGTGGGSRGREQGWGAIGQVA